MPTDTEPLPTPSDKPGGATPASPGVSYLLDTIKALEKRTSCLLEVSRFLREPHELHELLGRILAKAAELVGADAGIIALVEPGTQEFRFVNIHYSSLPPLEADKKEKALQEVRLKMTDGIIGQVHASGEPRILSDLSQASGVRRDIADSVEYAVRNLMAVPLSVDGDRLGALEFLNKTPSGTFTALDLDLAAAIANQIALVVEARRLRSPGGPQKDEALEKKLKALETENGSLEKTLKDLEAENASLKKKAEETRGRETTFTEQKDSLAAVAREETERRTAAEAALKEAREEAARASEKVDHLTKDMDTAFLVQKATQKKLDDLLLALEEKKRAEGRPEAHRSALMKAFSAVSSDQPTEVVLDTLLSAVATILESEAASLLLTDEDTGRLYFAAATGVKKDPLKKVLLKEGEGIAGWVAKNGSVLNIPDVARDARFSDQADKSADFITRSILAVPLFSESHLIGVAEAVNKKSGASFSNEDSEMLIALSLYGAMVIRKAQIYWDMNELLLSTVRALADAIDAKGAGGKGRAERVRRLSLALAGEVPLPPSQSRDVELAALLHDVGKIVMPGNGINEKEDLTEEEVRLLARAPVVAAEILSPVKPLKNAVPMVRHVHERWDGQGHPDKLKGEDIPAGSRVIAVASTYEAMTADRPYRRRLPEEVAIKEIQSLRGAQLDPAAVDALVRLYRKGKLKDLFK